jgi:acetyl-CoA carboxylase carboxyltransferase component
LRIGDFGLRSFRLGGRNPHSQIQNGWWVDAMEMKEEIQGLARRREAALRMGGPEKVERQHQQGKLTARERIDLLLDRGTFEEYGLLASHQSHRPQMKDRLTPADGVITGVGRIDGRPAGVVAEDFTVLGGSEGLTHFAKKLRMVEIATQERVPLVWLLDGSGARAEEFIGEGLPAVFHHLKIARMSGIAPQVGVIMGPSAGDSSLVGSLLEFIIMVRGTGMMAAGGPPVVLRATNETVTKEELGGVEVHCAISGVADNPAEDDRDALSMVKRYLSYLPSNAWEYPPSIRPESDLAGREEELLEILPANTRRPYDMKRIIHCVVDRGSFFEVKPLYAPMMITGLARLNGHPVGIVANQPMVHAGAITAKAAQKERHFIDLCSAYHIPLVFLVDVPGVMTGPQAEREGALRYGLAVAHSLAWADVPKMTVVVRKAFGFGGCAMCGYGAKQTVTLAWPTADFGSMPADSGVLAAYGAQLAEAADPEALRKKLEETYREFCGAYPAAGVFNVDDVIDPRETRARLIRAMELCLGRRSAAPAPVMRHGVMP